MKALLLGWAMIWRATILAPVFLLFFVIVCTTGLFRFFGPIWMAVMVFAEEWTLAAMGLPGWIGSILLWRWKRFRDLVDWES